MPCGLENASITLQHLTDNILTHCGNACAYMNDVFVFSATWQERLHHLDEALIKLGRAGLKLQNEPFCICMPIHLVPRLVVNKQGLHANAGILACIDALGAESSK